MLPCPCDATTAAAISAVSPGMNGSPATSRKTTTNTTHRPYCSTKCVTGPSYGASTRVLAMRVGVARESASGERRVALVPETVGKLAAAGFELVVEPGAGEPASFPDGAYRDAGAALGDPWDAEAVVKVRKPSAAERERLHAGQLLVGFLEPLSDPAGVEALSERGVTAFALEAIPRITRAQPMDALSSQATVGGYKAALLA